MTINTEDREEIIEERLESMSTNCGIWQRIQDGTWVNTLELSPDDDAIVRFRVDTRVVGARGNCDWIIYGKDNSGQEYTRTVDPESTDVVGFKAIIDRMVMPRASMSHRLTLDSDSDPMMGNTLVNG